MPIAMPRSDRVAQWDPRHSLDSFASPSLLYSGYLLKLGSNDRWQSRLFTFDGVVLSCVGKRSRAPPVATYDPHVSSPFASNFCHQQPYNPNTKWFLNLSSITDIRLLSSSRTFRCFPYNDVSRSLLIQTTDGRTLTLRAKKDQELERWYFVLSKLWTCQQLQFQQQQYSQYQRLHSQNPLSMQAAEYTDKDQDLDPHQNQRFVTPQKYPSDPTQNNLIPAASHLPAHQQSVHLFNKYLQRQQYHHDQEEHQPEQPQQQHGTHQQITKPRESFLQYQIPLPRVSAFLPQGLDWTNKRSDEDDEDEEDETAPEVEEEEEEEEDEEEDEEDEEVRVFLKTTPQDSNHIPPSQSLGWPTVGILEPAKAAAIDMWRRSLLSPLMRDRSRSNRSEESLALPQAQPPQKSRFTPSSRRPSGTKSLDLARVNKALHETKRKSDKCCSSKNEWESAKDPYVRTCVQREVAAMSDDNLPLAMVRSRQGSKCHGSQLPVNIAPPQLETHFSVSDSEVEQESSDVCRFTRWQKTQLSSVADTATNRDSFAALTTPDLNRNSFPSFPNCDSFLNFANRDRLPCQNTIGNNLSSSRTITPDGHSISPMDFVPSRTPLTSFPSKPSIMHSGKKRVITGILKRPSLPGLDTAVLEAAVSASADSMQSTGFSHTRSGEKISKAPTKPLNVNRTSSSTDPSLSLHGSSYSYLPIHDPDFVFSKPVNAANDLAYSVPSPAFMGDQDYSETVQPLLVCTKNAIPSIPPPPARPPRRRPVAFRLSKKSVKDDQAAVQIKGSPSVPTCLFSPTLWTCPEGSSPEVPRRNSEPTIRVLNMGLGIQLPQKEPQQSRMPERSTEVNQIDSMSVLTVATEEYEPQVHSEQAQAQMKLETCVEVLNSAMDIVQNQKEQKGCQDEFTETFINIASSSEEEEEIESVLSGESFSYF